MSPVKGGPEQEAIGSGEITETEVLRSRSEAQ